MLLTVAVILLRVFALGQTEYKVLWSFGSPNDGATPLGNLVIDHFSNFYGTTVSFSILART
jgi:hypothetical protein